ncbi:MAG: DNA-3-methyladenine glycosylase 2 family protein [Candidatus Yanofskybacteria bacterium]|nr:DNA-3-methyladenine glycosylase 2 family protein [Candidatus Yanofskybacteria bacterium]
MTYQRHLSQADPVMRVLVQRYTLRRISVAKDPLEELVASIVSQQLSVKAADTIWKRFLALYRGRMPSAPRLIATPIERIRTCGVSGSKAAYIKNVADAFRRGHLDRAHLMRMNDDEVRARLVAIKGVGNWTAEMFLIFALGRPDIFSVGDVGLQNAIQKLYRKRPTPKTMERLARAWAPYRSYAARYLWKSLDNTP